MRFSIPGLAIPFLAVLFSSQACRAIHGSMDAPEGVVLPADSIQIERDITSGVPPQFVPVLDAIRIALENGDELNARRSLAMLFGRRPTGRTLELAQGFERILDGRQRVRWLNLRLEAHELSGASGAFRLELVVSQSGPEDLVLHPGGAQLRVRQYAVDPDGHERRGARQDGVPFPKELRLPTGGAEQRFDVAQLDLQAPAGVLAYSALLILEFLPGEFVGSDGRYLPVQHIPAPEIELVRLAGFLPTTPVDPRELVRYVEEGRIYVPALMERAVRIPPEQRQLALDLLTDCVEPMIAVELELLVPALRWLARTRRPGGDPEAWRQWLLRRRSLAEERGRPNWEGMQLPEAK